MSSYKGKTVKNKNKLREEKKNLEAALKQEGNPLQELLSKIPSNGIYSIGYDKAMNLVDSNGIKVEQISGEGIAESIDRHTQKQQKQ